jgi:hypothetical protein
MNEAEFKEAVKRLKEVNEVISKLEADVRSLAMDVLEPYARGGRPAPVKREKRESATDGIDHGGDEAEFFSGHEKEKPADRVYRITAWFYSQYGSAEFEWTEIKTVADRVGLTVPARVDMTLAQSADKGKKLFRRAGKGKFAPTVTGEEFLKSKFGVRKGTRKRPEPVKATS